MPFNLSSLTAKIVLAVLGMLAVWWLLNTLTAKPKAEAKLSKNQAEAAAQSGAEAVNTVGKAGEREAASADMSRENERTIRDAKGADAAVDPAARDAGLVSLCRRSVYQRDPRCLPRPDTR